MPINHTIHARDASTPFVGWQLFPSETRAPISGALRKRRQLKGRGKRQRISTRWEYVGVIDDHEWAWRIFSVKRLTTVTLENRIFLRTVSAVIMAVNERDVIMTRSDKFDDRYFAYLTNMKYSIGKYRSVTLSRAPPAVLRIQRIVGGVFFYERQAILLILVAAPPGRTSAVRECDSSIRLIRLRARPVSVIAQTGTTSARVTMRNNTKFSASSVYLFYLFNYRPAARILGLRDRGVRKLHTRICREIFFYAERQSWDMLIASRLREYVARASGNITETKFLVIRQSAD